MRSYAYDTGVAHPKKKNAAAVALIRRRWAKTPKAGRSEAARKAARARWDRVKKAENVNGQKAPSNPARPT